MPRGKRYVSLVQTLRHKEDPRKVWLQAGVYEFVRAFDNERSILRLSRDVVVVVNNKWLLMNI